MMVNAQIDVCLPVYNGENFVEEALRSIAAQTFADIRVLASDNNSTDRTHQILMDWSSKIPMRVLKQPRTLNLENHFNTVLDAVEAPYYMILCHDDFFYSPRALELAHGVMAAQPEVSAVYSDLAYVGASSRLLMQRRFGRRGLCNGDEVGRASVRAARNLFGIPVLVRTADRGDIRYELDMDYLNDLDMSWSVSKERPLYHIDEPLIAFRVTGTNSTWSLIKSSEKSFLKMADKQGMQLSGVDRIRLRLVNYAVTQQKRLFGHYSQWVSPRP